MATPLNLKFDETGCTDTDVVCGGGVVFTDPSPIVNPETTNKCATFTAFDNSACITINTAGLDDIINDNTKIFTLYFRYKINIDIMDDETPILSYKIKSSDPYMVPLLNIQEKSYFSFHDKQDILYNSPNVSYTFDGKWHTFTLERRKKHNGKLYYCYFIDGCQRTYPDSRSKDVVDVSAATVPLYLGYIKNEYGETHTFNGGSIDNIVLTDYNVYNNSFVPPTLYFNGADVADNYYCHIKAKVDGIENDVVNEVERVIQHSKYHINEAQKDYLPRRIRIEWWQEINYFQNETYTPTRKHHRPDTILNIRLFEHSMWFHHKRFLKGNAYKLMMNNEIQPFVMFVDNRFVPISQIDFLKSDDNLNVIIKDRNTDNNEWVKSVSIITIPFPIIYEEGLGERVDLKPLYSFNKEGKFSVDNSYTYYYIDNKKNPNIAHIGIQEQYFPDLDDGGDGTDSPARYMRNIWRYGEFTTSNISGNDAILQFNPIDGKGSIKPGDEVVLYKNTTQIHRSRYDIVGDNLVKFYNYKDQDLTRDIVTMQIITDTTGSILEDLTTTKIVTVVATKDKQSVFDIPEVTDSEGFVYRKFLLFRGSLCMENKNRYTINYDNNTITFNDTEDFVDKGTSLLFVFVKIKKADQYGVLHVKPIYLYTTTKITESNGTCRKITIPSYRNLTYNINQIMLFIQGTFISPNRYKIENNTIIFTQSNDYFMPNKTVTFILLKMANKFEDPLDDRDKLINEQLKKGSRFVLYDLYIDKKRKITLDNLVTFDKNGEYIPDLYGYIYNMNIVKELHSGDPLSRTIRYLTCVYYKDSLDNYANVILPYNNEFIKDYISLRQEFYEIDNHFDDFVQDFDTYHKSDKSYGVNLANALNYIVTYNQNLLDRVFENNTTCTRRTYKGSDFNAHLRSSNGKYYLDIYGDNDFKAHKHYSHPIFFVNGEYALWNKDIIIKGNKNTLVFSSRFNANDVIEAIYFHHLNNYFLLPLGFAVTS